MHELIAAVAGVGFVGRAHIEALRRLGVRVIGILESTPEQGRRAAQRLGVPRSYSGIQELLADDDVDVVHVCTPNGLHYGMSQAALAAGKHVVCEKPLAMNSDQARELVQMAEETERSVAAVNHNLRYYPLCQEARARVEAGDLGDVRIVHGEYLQDWLFLPTDWNWRVDPAQGGELRAVADIGTHWMDMITWITGQRITEVFADLTTFIRKRLKPAGGVETFAGASKGSQGVQEVGVNTEDYATILLALDGGARGALTVSQISAGRKNHFWWEINGSKASMSWDQECPNRLWMGYRERPNEDIIKDPALMQTASREFADYPGGHAEGYPDTFKQLHKDIYGYIAAGDFSLPPPFPTFEEGYRQMVLCETILRSTRDGRWVQVPNE